jgi:hypothetical protein
MTQVGQAVGAALTAIAAERSDLLLVADPAESAVRGGPVAGWLGQAARAWPRRVVTAPPGHGRPAVGVGAALAGQRAVVVLDGGPALPPPAVTGCAPPVLVAGDPLTVAPLWGAGWRVVVPAWPSDVEAHLRAALATQVATVVLVHDAEVPARPPERLPEATPASPARVLCRGEFGLVVGCGAAVPLLAEAARLLGRRGLPVTAVELHTWDAAAADVARLPPWALQGALAVGPDASTAAGLPGTLSRLRRVPLPADGPREVAEAVLGALPAIR